jgi:predicted permease
MLTRLLRRLMPSRDRARYGDEIASVRTAMRADESRAAGVAGVGVFWMRELVDAIRIWIRERAPRRTTRAPSSPRNRGGQGPHPITSLRWAWRGLRARGTQAVFVIGLLALAIAATTTVFSAADSFVLRRVPYADAGGLVVMQSSQFFGPSTAVSHRSIAEWRNHTDLFAGVHAHTSDLSIYLTIGDLTESIPVVQVTPGLVEMLGVQPIAGRFLVPADAEPGAEPVALIAQTLARRRYGGESVAIGQMLAGPTGPIRVVGVMPSSFHYPSALEQVWRPLDLPRVKNRLVEAVARLAPGVSLPAAAARFESRVAAVEEAASGRYRERDRLQLVSLSAALEDARASMLFAMLGAAALCLLLIACANVTCLELATAAGRMRAYAVQTALGASRRALVGVAMVEGVLMVGAAAALGGLLARWAVAALASGLPMSMTDELTNAPDLDARAVVATTAIAAIAWLVTSLPIAWRATRVEVLDALRRDTRTSAASRGEVRIRQTLMSAQIALTVLLLVGALLFARTYANFLAQAKGFDSRNVVGLYVAPPSGSTIDKADLERQVLARMRAYPGVLASARTWALPPSTGGGRGGELTIVGREGSEGQIKLSSYSVDPEYFETVGIGMQAGRAFTNQDALDKAVVDEAFATRYFPRGDALGQVFQIGSSGVGGITRFEIIGIAKHMRPDVTALPSGDPVFVAYYQLGPKSTPLIFVARLNDVGRLESLAREVRAIAPGCLVRAYLIDERYADLYGDTRVAASVSTGFALLAFLIAMAGVYRVRTVLVAGRRREIGIRLALGADRGRIRSLVFGSSLRFIGGGTVLGLASALVATRWINAQLFGVAGSDPSTYATVTLAILLTATAATWLPARQAARVDPARTLRDE